MPRGGAEAKGVSEQREGVRAKKGSSAISVCWQESGERARQGASWQGECQGETASRMRGVVSQVCGPSAGGVEGEGER